MWGMGRREEVGSASRMVVTLPVLHDDQKEPPHPPPHMTSGFKALVVHTYLLVQLVRLQGHEQHPDTPFVVLLANQMHQSSCNREQER